MVKSTLNTNVFVKHNKQLVLRKGGMDVSKTPQDTQDEESQTQMAVSNF